MIDSIAKAMAESDRDSPYGGRLWSGMTDDDSATETDNRNWWRALAVAGLTAMRKPTNEMLQAGYSGTDGSIPYDRDAEVVWQDMIDRALKG